MGRRSRTRKKAEKNRGMRKREGIKKKPRPAVSFEERGYGVQAANLGGEGGKKEAGLRGGKGGG